MISSDIAERWRALSQSFDQIAWYRPWNHRYNGRRSRTRSIGFGFGRVFQVPARINCVRPTFSASKEIEPGNDQVVVLGNHFSAKSSWF